MCRRHHSASNWKQESILALREVKEVNCLGSRAQHTAALDVDFSLWCEDHQRADDGENTAQKQGAANHLQHSIA